MEHSQDYQKALSLIENAKINDQSYRELNFLLPLLDITPQEETELLQMLKEKFTR